MNKKRMTESELKEYANKIASRVAVPHSEGKEFFRKSTEQEREIIFNIAYGALNGLNYQGAIYKSVAAEAIICSAEYTLGRFLPQLNAYFTIWVPLMNLVWDYTDEIINPD